MYVKASELARRLGVTVKTIYNLMNSGIIPRGMKFGKSRRWDWQEVDDFLKHKSAGGI